MEAAFNLGELYVQGIYGEKTSNVEALYWYKKSAKMGNDQAMIKVGYIYAEGEGGIKKDYITSLKWYKKALNANKNNKSIIKLERENIYDEIAFMYEEAEALEIYKKIANESEKSIIAYIGELYKSGIGNFEKNYSKALEYYKKSEKKGSIESIVEIGRIYTKGEYGVLQNYQKAFETFRRAAELGSSDAMLEIGSFYEDGLLVSQSFTKAIKWYKKAAELGNVDAMIMIAELYDDDDENNMSTDDYEEVVKWYVKAAEKGNYKAMDALGMVYSGSYFSKYKKYDNFIKALYWHHKLYHSDLYRHDFIFYEIKDLFEEYLGDIQRTEDALDFFKICEEMGIYTIPINIGFMYEGSHKRFFHNRLFQKNIEKSVIWYEKAVKLGGSKAMLTIANIHEELSLTDDSQALKWYKRSAREKNVSAMRLAGEIYEMKFDKENEKKALKWYMRAAKHADGLAMTKIGDLYTKGGYEVERNYQKALYWYLKANKKGDGGARFRIANLYEEGSKQIKKNYSKALMWYKYGINNQNYKDNKLGPMNKVADIYFTGDSTLKKNWKEALKYYEMRERYYGARLDVLVNHIKIYYEGGHGVERDHNKALELCSQYLSLNENIKEIKEVRSIYNKLKKK